MQHVLRWSEGISAYQSKFKDMDFEIPERCTHCGCGKFHKWGSYKRYVIEEEGEHEIHIQRIRCVKCGKTTSYLPSFCLSGICYGLEFVIKILKALLLKTRFSFGELRRRAYAFLRRFTQAESLWLVFLRAGGFLDFPENGKDKRREIFTALLKIHQSGDLLASFFQETGRHFMSTK